MQGQAACPRILNTMRPKLICHMISSIDGRLLVDRWSKPAAGIDPEVLRGHYDQVAERFEADGWIVGRKSMGGLTKNPPREQPAIPEAIERVTHHGNRSGRGLAVLLDPHGKLHYGRDEVMGDHVVAVLGEGVSDAYLAELRQDGVSYVFAGPDGRDTKRALDIIGDEFDAGTLLLEGGGIVNGALLEAGLIDEISVLIYPGIDGLSGVPGIFDHLGAPGHQPAKGLSLRHQATETLSGGMVWLHYLVEEAPKN
jgi:riboflavin biosynthesis pyrimidine reductase